jgi:hypothetical protein
MMLVDIKSEHRGYNYNRILDSPAVDDPIGHRAGIGERGVGTRATLHPAVICTASIHSPSLRRRAFSIHMHRAGVGVFSLQKLLSQPEYSVTPVIAYTS